MVRSQTEPSSGETSPNVKNKCKSANHLQSPVILDGELTPTASTEGDVPSLKDPLLDMEISEVKEPPESSINNPESEAMADVEQKEDSQLDTPMKVDENEALSPDPVTTDVDRDNKGPKDSRIEPSVTEEQLPLGESKILTTSLVSPRVAEQVVGKAPSKAAPLPSNEEEKPRVSDEDEEKSLDAFEKKATPSINQIVPAELPANTERPANTNVVIGELGGEHVVKTFPSEKEIAGGLYGKESLAENNQIEAENELNAPMSKSDSPLRIVKKLSKERTEGIFEQTEQTLKHTPSQAALMADQDSGELYDARGVVKSGERVDDRSKLDISFAKKSEEISLAFNSGDLSTVDREIRKDKLDGVEQLGIVKNKSGVLTESEISRHYTAEEMARMDLVDAAKRKDEIERLMTEDFKRKTSSTKQVAVEIDGRTRFRKDSLLRKMNEKRIKKTIDEKELKVNVGVKDRKSKYLAMASQSKRESLEKKKRKVSAGDIRKSRGNAHSKYINSVKRQSSQTVSGRPKSPILRRSSRPRLSAKRESWRRESERGGKPKDLKSTSAGVSQRNRSHTEHKASDEKYRAKNKSPRLSASEIERAKLKAVEDLASKQSYPYGPNAAKMLEARKSDSLLSIEKSKSELYSTIDENEADE